MERLRWIPWFLELNNHRKVKRLAREAQIHPTYALGVLAKLWMMGASEAQDGELSSYVTPQELAHALGFDTETGVRVVEALVSTGWLDEYDAANPDDTETVYVIHDWMDHTGAFIAKVRESRAQDRARKRRLVDED